MQLHTDSGGAVDTKQGTGGAKKAKRGLNKKNASIKRKGKGRSLRNIFEPIRTKAYMKGETRGGIRAKTTQIT